MNLRVVFLMLGRLQMALAGALLMPCGVGWYTGEGDGPAFLAAAMIAGIGASSSAKRWTKEVLAPFSRSRRTR